MQNLYSHAPYIFSKHLRNLVGILGKTKEFMKENNISDAEMLEKRIAPDMFPFVRQIQIVSDAAKGTIARMAGIEAPSMPDTEATIDECIARIEKTILFIDSIDTEKLSQADEHNVVLPYLPGKHQTMIDYVLDMAIPNFFFHFTTAYNIARGAGVELGKMDYIGSLKLHDLT